MLGTCLYDGYIIFPFYFLAVSPSFDDKILTLFLVCKILTAFEYKAGFVCWFEFDTWSFCPAPLIYLSFLFIFCCTTWLPFPVLVNSRCIFKWKYVSVDLLPWIFGITVISSHSIAFLCNNWDIKMVSSSCYELILKHKKWNSKLYIDPTLLMKSTELQNLYSHWTCLLINGSYIRLPHWLNFVFQFCRYVSHHL